MLACQDSEAEGASTEGGASTTELQPSFGGVLKNVDCEPGHDLIGIRSRMKGVSASWKICTPASEEHEYDGLGPIGRGLKVFAENDRKAAGRINFHPAGGKQAAMVHLNLLAPNDFAASAFMLLGAAMGNPSFCSVIAAEFIGLSLEDGSTNRIPKLSEFTDPDLLKRRGIFRGTSA